MATVKRQLNYSLSVLPYQATEAIVIKPPFTIEFDITRDTLGSVNQSKIRVYNLSEKNRSLLRRDVTALNQVMRIQFKAGYGNDLSVMFNGNVSQGWSIREGQNFITELQSFDGGYAANNAYSYRSFEGGTTNNAMIGSFMDDLTKFGLERGALGEFPGKIGRGNAHGGSTFNILTEMTNSGFFVDNGKANCLQENEYIDGNILLITAKSGLLGTPVRENTNIRFEMLLEPKVQVAHAIRLDSGTAKNFNGTYKVVGVSHRGMISESVAGNATTSVTMFAPRQLIPVPQGG